LSLASFLVFHRFASNLFFPEEYRATVKKYAAEYDLDPLLISSVIYTESHYDPSVVSHKGAVGLMQVLPSTAAFISKKRKMPEITEKDLKNPETNIRIGCVYLRYLLDRHENDELVALAAYNAGSKNVTNWKKESKEDSFSQTLQSHGFKETKNYVKSVQKIYQRLTRLNLIRPL